MCLAVFFCCLCCFFYIRRSCGCANARQIYCDWYKAGFPLSVFLADWNKVANLFLFLSFSLFVGFRIFIVPLLWWKSSKYSAETTNIFDLLQFCFLYRPPSLNEQNRNISIIRDWNIVSAIWSFHLFECYKIISFSAERQRQRHRHEKNDKIPIWAKVEAKMVHIPVISSIWLCHNHKTNHNFCGAIMLILWARYFFVWFKPDFQLHVNCQSIHDCGLVKKDSILFETIPGVLGSFIKSTYEY